MSPSSKEIVDLIFLVVSMCLASEVDLSSPAHLGTVNPPAVHSPVCRHTARIYNVLEFCAWFQVWCETTRDAREAVQ